jgi:cytochrome P450
MAPLLKVMATYPLATVFAGLLFSSWIVTKLLTARRQRLFATSRGCGKLKMRPQWDRLFGIDFFFTVMKKREKGQDLAYFNEMFQEIGSTFGIVMMGFTLTMTNEPENIQAVLARQFADFEIGESRSKGGQQMLGHGILNSDGEAWERGRAMLRPSFVRSQVGDFDLFENNFQRLIDVVPADGSTVDIQEFLSRFVSRMNNPFQILHCISN